MTTLSADKIRRRRGTPQLERYAISTGQTVYVGSSALIVDSTGRLRKGESETDVAATAREVAGVVVKLEDSDGGVGSGVGDASGTEYAIVDYGSEFLFDLHSDIQTATSLRKNLFCGNDDDNLAAGTACAATSGSWVPLGQLMAFEASDKSTGWIRVARFGKNDVAQ